MSLSDRIREAMGDMTPSDFARATHVTPASVTFWLDGTTKSLKAEKAAEIERATGYRATWIVTGKGPKMMNEVTPGTTLTVTEPAPSYDMGPEGEFVMVPQLQAHTAGEIELAKDNPQVFRTEWMRQRGVNPAKSAWMRASGDSMQRTMFDGDSLLVDTSDTHVVDNGVYALWYGDDVRVKRLFRLPGGGLRIVSDHHDKNTYPDLVVRPEELQHVRIIGRIFHRSGAGGL